MFDWQDFLRVAEDLAARGDEAALRSAISRAYYAAFCSARNYLRDVQGRTIPKTGAAHRIVWDEFEAGSDNSRRQVATLGVRLRRSRNRADYDDELARVADIANDAIHNANNVLDLLQDL
jgi:uncharacterized protein (UPF0332 family)